MGENFTNYIEDVEWVNMKKFFDPIELEKEGIEKNIQKAYAIGVSEICKEVSEEELWIYDLNKEMKVITFKEIAKIISIFYCVKDSSLRRKLFWAFTSMEIAKEDLHLKVGRRQS